MSDFQEYLIQMDDFLRDKLSQESIRNAVEWRKQQLKKADQEIPDTKEIIKEYIESVKNNALKEGHNIEIIEFLLHRMKPKTDDRLVKSKGVSWRTYWITFGVWTLMLSIFTLIGILWRRS